MSNASLVRLIARDLKLPGKRVRHVLELLAEGCTIPFIARYRKDRTGNLGEGAIRRIRERLDYYEKLEAEKAELLKLIEEKGRLTEELRRRIERASEKMELQDLAAMFRGDGPSDAELARERGLGQIAVMLQMQMNPRRDVDSLCEKLADPEKGVPDAKAALQGALHILAAQTAEDADNRRFVSELVAREAKLVARVVPGKEEAGKNFENYFEFSVPLSEVQPKDILTVRRGVSEGVLSSGLELDPRKALEHVTSKLAHTSDSGIAELLESAAKRACETLLLPHSIQQANSQLDEIADTETVVALKKSLRNILLSPPAGTLRTLAIDPGFRGGCRLAALDENGQPIDNSTIYLGQSRKRKDTAKEKIFSVVQINRLDAICIGKGPGCRQAESLVREVIREIKDRKVLRVTLNRSAVERYASSELGKTELPDLDEATRAAVSIARRFQEPIKEFVKVKPWQLQLGPHQRQVDQQLLKEKLTETVESCVNFVGADVNTASRPMLAHISGLSEELATEIIKRREANGSFRNRAELLSLPGFTPKIFEQAAGFLRVCGGDEPLDATGIHPEHYDLVRAIAAELEMDAASLLGNPGMLEKVDWGKHQDRGGGRRALKFIRSELSDPGRDQRGEFEPDLHHDAVQKIDDLVEGMILPGTVTNVTQFGAFIDIGVRMEGLVHVSQMSRRFIKDPARVVSIGDRVMVKILKIEKERKRISLSMKQAKGKPPAPGPAEQAPAADATAKPEADAPTPDAQAPAAPPETAPEGAEEGTEQKAHEAGPPPEVAETQAAPGATETEPQAKDAAEGTGSQQAAPPEDAVAEDAASTEAPAEPGQPAQEPDVKPAAEGSDRSEPPAQEPATSDEPADAPGPTPAESPPLAAEPPGETPTEPAQSGAGEPAETGAAGSSSEAQEPQTESPAPEAEGAPPAQEAPDVPGPDSEPEGGALPS